jgi:hypothetical protein
MENDIVKIEITLFKKAKDQVIHIIDEVHRYAEKVVEIENMENFRGNDHQCYLERLEEANMRLDKAYERLQTARESLMDAIHSLKM